MSNLDEWGRTPLHYAARDGDLDAIAHLLTSDDVNAADIHGWTPLHFAAQNAHPRRSTACSTLAPTSTR